MSKIMPMNDSPHSIKIWGFIIFNRSFSGKI